VLKRLADALADGDTLHAVIRGSAVNNDGSVKVGFTAPSVAGQSAVVSRALRDARVPAETISYVEAHGTGTPLGDPIEIASLTRAFGATPARASCPLGSVKSNVGHLDRAAGVSGLIKTVLSLEHAEIPPTLHFESPNPQIDFAGSPFYVNARLAPWPVRPDQPRRAGVNSLGMGGTNVHVVLEEAPAMPATTPGRTFQLVPLSAQSEAALAAAAADLADHLRRNPDTDLADAAFTLQTGREAFDHRLVVTSADVAGLVAALENPVTGRHLVAGDEPDVRVHLVDHEPARHVLAALRVAEPEFAAAAEECEHLLASTGGGAVDTAAVFVAQYATVRLLRSWGVPVHAVTGEGVGAYAAAAASGALPVAEALALLRTGQPAPPVAVDEPGSRITVAVGPGTVATPDARAASGHLDGVGRLHEALGHLWLLGVPVDWARYHAGERRRRIPLPGYPFQRARFWIDPPAVSASDRLPAGEGPVVVDSCSASRAPVGTSGPTDPRELLSALPRRTVDDWFYLPGWRQTAPPLAAALPTDGGWVVFADETGVADRLMTRLASMGASTVRVGAGERFGRTTDGGYLIRPNSAADFARLVEELSQAPGALRRLVHLWTLDDPADPQDAPGFLRERGYTSLVWLAQALGRTTDPHDLVVVSTSTQDVTGLDEVDPDRAIVTGPCRVLPLELSTVTCRQVDVARPVDPPALAGVADQVLRECVAETRQPLVAWRTGRRWVPDYQPLPVAPLDGDLRPLRERGVYLITGGLGGVGLSIGRGLARTVSARLVLMTRTGMPPRDEWPGLLSHPETVPSVRSRIEAVLELERLGAEVLVCAADVADPAGVAAALEEARSRFGAVDGVVHAAGVPGMGLLQFKTPEGVFEAMAPKVDGSRVLQDLLSTTPPDFVVLFSSITAITGGGPGQADYCSANAYLDAFANAAAPAGPNRTRVVSIGWGEWQWNAWAQGLSGYAPEARAFFEENRRRFGISFDEGWQAFLRVLRSGQRHVLVSTQDFAEIVRLSPQFSVANVLELGAGTRVKHARPELGTPFVAPRTGPEKVIAGLWADALGLVEVGSQDNFFELGGNSLLGVDLVARVCRELGHAGLPPHVLYLAPTVRELAEVASGSEQREWVDDRRDRGAMRREGMRRRRSE
jgi:acyl transferase domain-containing protein